MMPVLYIQPSSDRCGVLCDAWKVVVIHSPDPFFTIARMKTPQLSLTVVLAWTLLVKLCDFSQAYCKISLFDV
jgi:hypothetical protein